MKTCRHKVRLSIFFFTDFSCDLGFTARLESGSSTLRGELGAIFLWFVCVTPLRLGGGRRVPLALAERYQ
jgi:hypothetical protein